MKLAALSRQRVARYGMMAKHRVAADNRRLALDASGGCFAKPSVTIHAYPRGRENISWVHKPMSDLARQLPRVGSCPLNASEGCS